MPHRIASERRIGSGEHTCPITSPDGKPIVEASWYYGSVEGRFREIFFWAFIALLAVGVLYLIGFRIFHRDSVQQRQPYHEVVAPKEARPATVAPPVQQPAVPQQIIFPSKVEIDAKINVTGVPVQPPQAVDVEETEPPRRKSMWDPPDSPPPQH